MHKKQTIKNRKQKQTMSTKNQITAGVETVTVDKANEWLSKNTGNRAPKLRLITKIAADIEKGRWKINGEAIVLSVGDARLLDGQNRLYAVQHAGKPIQSIVVHGVEIEAFDTLDSGSSRSTADVLRIQGKANSVVLAGAASLVWRHLNEGLAISKTLPSTGAIEETIRTFPEIQDCVRMCVTGGRQTLISAASVAALTFSVQSARQRSCRSMGRMPEEWQPIRATVPPFAGAADQERHQPGQAGSSVHSCSLHQGLERGQGQQDAEGSCV